MTKNKKTKLIYSTFMKTDVFSKNWSRSPFCHFCSQHHHHFVSEQIIPGAVWWSPGVKQKEAALWSGGTATDTVRLYLLPDSSRVNRLRPGVVFKNPLALQRPLTDTTDALLMCANVVLITSSWAFLSWATHLTSVCDVSCQLFSITPL